MSRFSSIPVRAKASVGVLLFTAVAGLIACDEDGKTAPDRCADPVLPIFDIQAGAPPADDNAQYPCVTQVGHAINQIGTTDSGGVGPDGTAGGAGKGGSGGTSSPTDAGGADAGGAGAGAGAGGA